MRFIEPSVEYWKQEDGLAGVWKQIAKATRTCYQSTPKNNGESDEDFVKRVILKPALIKGDLNDLEDCEFDFDAMHGSVLEQGTIYIILNSAIKDALFQEVEDINFFEDNKYSEVSGYDPSYITTNMRVIIENHKEYLFDRIVEPTEYHKRRYTFSIITNIGVTKECNRHRVNSPSEESTRWCTYSAGKFGSEITYVKQPWMGDIYNKAISLVGNLTKEQQVDTFKDWCERIANDDISSWTKESYLMFGLAAAEFSYMGMKNNHATNDEARTVLNHGTKTQEVITAFKDDWNHFLSLRADNASGIVHPDMGIIANKIKQLIKENNL